MSQGVTALNCINIEPQIGMYVYICEIKLNFPPLYRDTSPIKGSLKLASIANFSFSVFLYQYCPNSLQLLQF